MNKVTHQDKISAQSCLENGWTIACSTCGLEFGQELWDYDEDVAIAPVFDGTDAFCCEGCHQQWKRDRVQHKHITQQIKACIRSAYPDADFTYVGLYYVRFRLPGLIRSAWWLFEDGGCKYFVWPGDKDNHENYLKERDKKRKGTMT